MLFASDLDRTLIYSEKFIDKSLKELNIVMPVEYKDEEIISYMSEGVMGRLTDIYERVLFIPVTTRTIEQYMRIKLFKNNITPEYSVVSNGGNIIKNGSLDLEWNKKIKCKIKNECLDIEEVLNAFKEIRSDNWILKLREADELFLYCIIDKEKLPSDELKDFSDWLKEKNWRTILHGKKLYFIPNCVNKRDAILHIAEIENEESIIAAGDSILDLDMAEIANHFISPRHGEIYNIYREQIKQKVEFTKNSGIAAGDEIVESVIERIKAS